LDPQDHPSAFEVLEGRRRKEKDNRMDASSLFSNHHHHCRLHQDRILMVADQLQGMQWQEQSPAYHVTDYLQVQWNEEEPIISPACRQWRRVVGNWAYKCKCL